MKRIRCLILDLGGVITLPQRADKVVEMIETTGAKVGRGEFLSAYTAHRSSYDRGTADAARYWRAVAKDLGIRLDEERIERLVAVDIQSWFNINEKTIEFLRGARGEVGRLAMLSNLPDDGAAHLRRSYDWVSLFDDLVLSCEHSAIKPERRIYEICLERCGAEAGEALFLDDSAENAEGAREAGMEAIRFTSLDEAAARIREDYVLAR